MCETCGKRYRGDDELANHMKAHKKVQCEECGMSVQEDQLEAHHANHGKIRRFAKTKIPTFKPPAKPKLLMAYTLWQADERKKILRENPLLIHTQVSSELGKRWKSVPQAEKQRLKISAQEMNVRKLCFFLYYQNLFRQRLFNPSSR